MGGYEFLKFLKYRYLVAKCSIFAYADSRIVETVIAESGYGKVGMRHGESGQSDRTKRHRQGKQYSGHKSC